MSEPVGAAGPRAPEVDGPEPSTPGPSPLRAAGQRALEAWEGAVDTVREAARAAGRAVRQVDDAVDVEGRVRDLGPGDAYRLRAQGSARVVAGAAGGGAVEVRRLDDGRYRVSAQGDLQAFAGAKLGSAVSGRLERGLAAKVELTCETPEDAARLLRFLRDAQLAPLGMPLGRHPAADLARESLTALEVTGRDALALEASLGLPDRPLLDVRGGLRSEQTARLELEPDGPVLVAQTAVVGDVGAALSPRTVGPRATGGVSAGQGARMQTRLQTETRVPLGEGPARTLAGARTRVTLATELRASGGPEGVGREVRASAELPTAVAALGVAALVRGDVEAARPLLDAHVRAESRDYRERGGELGASFAVGVVGGGLVLEARLRDAADRRDVTEQATLRDVLTWVQDGAR